LLLSYLLLDETLVPLTVAGAILLLLGLACTLLPARAAA
jgi:drug/metabolite transporter (DMT)-like permease